MMGEMKEGMMDGKMGGMCKCPHHKVVPGLTVLFGLLFLAGNMGWVSMETVAWWPVLVILAGLMKMSRGMCKCCSMGGHCGAC